MNIRGGTGRATYRSIGWLDLSAMSDPNSRTWTSVVQADPEHSRRYIERFKEMEDQGRDLHGEARLVDAMVARGARILDAGCGPGRVGGRLVALGHTVVGVDLDPVLLEEANRAHPGGTWVHADLEVMDLDGPLVGDGFDLIVSAGNVVPFIRPEGRRPALERMARHLGASGRAVIGFGAGRGYGFDTFLDDAGAAGLVVDHLASTWDLRPFGDDSDFVVAILGPR